MRIKKVWAVYFSGTGTTEKTVRRIAAGMAQALDAELAAYDFTTPAARQRELRFGTEELVVLGVPVYAGRVPNVLLPYLTKLLHGGGALAVPVVLFGNRNFDDGLIELRNILTEDGFMPVAGGAFVGEHAFSRTLGAGRPNGDDLAGMDAFARRAAEKVTALTAAPAEPVAVRGETPVRPYYTPRDRHGNPINILKVKPKTDMDRCGGCGLCAARCPMGSIDPADVSQVTGICIKCCACVKGCPAEAKYFDDAGYLYHKSELEEVYARPAANEVFLQGLDAGKRG